MTIRVAADGSALGNPGPAGWAWYVNDERWGAGGWKHATNNQAELTAVLELLRATKHVDDELLILCDSQYVINCLTQWMPGWKRKGWRKADGKPVLNVGILQELDAELQGRNYRFEWVKGHANHPLNEAADTRARAVAEAYQRGQAVPSGPGWNRNGSCVPVTEFTQGSAYNTAPEPPGGTEHNTVFDDPTHDATHDTAADRALFGPASHSEQPSLFSFEDDRPQEVYHLTIELNDVEMLRLSELASARGLSLSDALRSLIRNGV
ncbi:ribonuclease H [Lysinibacter sp. HNR]|uniref:ribonuclease H family protein n=1 Tax=Lysinibacter sp. HNR TaxID=3031408 RepID=UPI0024354156|nr:ribonuclease H [Lysinibacter sp. HNR]WGD37476.1 ribonuclease HI [Lysinibacter sp. HNR]